MFGFLRQDTAVGPVLERHGGRFVVGNALEFEPETAFDLVWDHTFFCAIHPSLRARWGERARTLLGPEGRYASLVFPFRKPASEGGPPFGMDGDVIAESLGEDFELLTDEAVSASGET